LLARVKEIPARNRGNRCQAGTGAKPAAPVAVHAGGGLALHAHPAIADGLKRFARGQRALPENPLASVWRRVGTRKARQQ
jgi:hypothetical protein